MNRRSPWYPVAAVGTICMVVLGWRACTETASVVTPATVTSTLPRLPTLPPTATITSLAPTLTASGTIIVTRPIPTGAVERG